MKRAAPAYPIPGASIHIPRVEYEEKKIIAAMKRTRGGRKVPTSVALAPELVEAIKEEAEKRAIPYQILLRMFIVDGFKKLKKVG